MTPGTARFALLSFLGLSAGVMVNLLWLQQELPAARMAGPKAASMQPVAPAAPRGAELQRAAVVPTRLASRLSDAGRAELDGRATEVRDWESRLRVQPGAAGTKPAEPEMQAVRVKAALSAGTARDGDNATPDTIRAIQRELSQQGYEPGTADGVAGLATRAAAMAFERDQGLPVTGDLTELLLQRLLLGVPPIERAVDSVAATGGNAERVVRGVQETLSTLGYAPGTPDGRFSVDTERAIREFELDNGMKPSGRISGPLIARLAKRSGQGVAPVVAGRAGARPR